MTLIRWNPWSISSALNDDWELPTIPGLSRLGQGLNLYETEQSVVAEVALPGIPEDKVDVTVEDGVVRITGSAESKENSENSSQRKYYMTSMVSAYNYSFRLPETVGTDKEPTAELENGVLTLTFPKAEVVPPKRITVSKKVNKK